MTSLTESMVHWLQEYEAMGKRKREEALARAEGAGSDFMQTLGHVQQIELLHGLNDMASELKSFLVSLLAATNVPSGVHFNLLVTH